MCLVVTDGSAVLGLGNIGPEAGMPVMEGKCVLFKAFGDVDAFPLCIKSNDVDEIVNTIYMISGSFGGVNLEDISAPRCFEIEKKLKEKCDIPIFHDDQHGTAIITLAGLTNALKVVGKKKEDVRIVMNGAGAAAISIARLLLTAGFKNITLCDRKGAIYEGRPEGMNPIKEEMAKVTNLAKKSGSLAEMLVGADVFIGVSAPGAVTTEMVKTMNKDAIIFACANPTPEIFPDDAKAGGAKVISTGRSDFPNQINNVSGFPYIFRGALDTQAKAINEAMKIAAVHAIANLAKQPVPDVVNEAYHVTTSPSVPNTSSRNRLTAPHHRSVLRCGQSCHGKRCSSQRHRRLGCLPPATARADGLRKQTDPPTLRHRPPQPTTCGICRRHPPQYAESCCGSQG